MKRSSSVRRILLGSLSAGALAATAAALEPRVTPESFYTNDYHLPGAGYYHAPFQAFFPRPYNSYDAARQQYFFGGQWGAQPHRSIVNISTPTPEAARAAEALRTDTRRTDPSRPYIQRSGFGRSSGSHFSSS